jgi:hypothetical protein
MFSPEWEPVLIDASQRAELAQQQLVRALQSFAELPGNLEVVPSSVLRNLLQIPWSRELAITADLQIGEVAFLRSLLDEWQQLGADGALSGVESYDGDADVVR